MYSQTKIREMENNYKIKNLNKVKLQKKRENNSEYLVQYFIAKLKIKPTVVT